jgi:hypothetical protein
MMRRLIVGVGVLLLALGWSQAQASAPRTLTLSKNSKLVLPGRSIRVIPFSQARGFLIRGVSNGVVYSAWVNRVLDDRLSKEIEKHWQTKRTAPEPLRAASASCAMRGKGKSALLDCSSRRKVASTDADRKTEPLEERLFSHGGETIYLSIRSTGDEKTLQKIASSFTLRGEG